MVTDKTKTVKTAKKTTKKAATKKTPAKKVVAKKATTQKSTRTVKRVAKKLSQDQLHNLISECAYFLAKEHNFTPGMEVTHWLEAEKAIKEKHC